jgi:hypothetical protein
MKAVTVEQAMASPFPGMDPYLEDYWSDFHSAFLVEIRNAILAELPAGYDARIQERIRIVEELGEGRAIYPDVAVERDRERPVHGGGGPSVVTLEPVRMQLPEVEEVRELSLHIWRRPNRQLTTVIEVLSPANKVGRGREVYLAKREEVLADQVHLVEIDLLLGGQRLPVKQSLPPGDYYAIVSRWEQRRECEVYAWAGDRVLPEVPVPLSRPDPDIPLDLAASLRRAYDAGFYESAIDYTQPPPGVPDAERAWIASRRVRK